MPKILWDYMRMHYLNSSVALISMQKEMGIG